ncbi:hypothetical protein SSABA_v1c04830 [Spiroplasma sabaudiense Ar-1343]|uniref:Uncharacterized protein n=1 Tax=Spiroplasma sabaudiense Ar-1343 TaxID=1276257 RepID=W6AAL1_9MOLU|nr:hypothetical protein [Spiroplasma sabaudiense]AHI53890.1 hypothetical protein SSABA_v1c04830 [Spiroplasma sabaudiense Ar-1343]
MDKKIKFIKSGLIFSEEFIKKWLNEDGYTYVNFKTNKKYRIDLENKPLVELLFEEDDSFDGDEVKHQFYKISQEARFIIDEKIINKKQPELSGSDLLFLRYFFFLISVLNGDYRFKVKQVKEVFCVLDILENELNFDLKHNLLQILNYVLFELYDSLFTSQLFADLSKFIDRYEENSNLGDEKIILISEEDFENQEFGYIELYFHQLVNNNFMKIFKISDFEEESFLLNNQMTGNFVDDKSKISLLSLMVVDPSLAIGFINLGPGKGEFRPLFDYIQNNRINTDKIPSILHPNHRVILSEEDSNENNRFIFKPLLLRKEQIQLINFAINIKGIKIAIGDLTRQTNKK